MRALPPRRAAAFWLRILPVEADVDEEGRGGLDQGLQGSRTGAWGLGLEPLVALAASAARAHDALDQARVRRSARRRGRAQRSAHRRPRRGSGIPLGVADRDLSVLVAVLVDPASAKAVGVDDRECRDHPARRPARHAAMRPCRARSNRSATDLLGLSRERRRPTRKATGTALEDRDRDDAHGRGRRRFE